MKCSSRTVYDVGVFHTTNHAPWYSNSTKVLVHATQSCASDTLFNLQPYTNTFFPSRLSIRLSIRLFRLSVHFTALSRATA